MRRILIVITLFILSTAHAFLLGKVTEGFKLLPKNEDTAFVMPVPMLKLAALDFRGVASDYLFLNSLVFIGSTQERTEEPRVKSSEWKWLYRTLDASTSLDPYFLDAYYFANAQLTWDALMIEEDNLLLEKGSKYRDWDSLLPFYIGFNYFYFLQDHENARKWLLEASKRPDAPSLYAHLADNLGYQKKSTENSILFLEEMSRRTDDKALKKMYEARIDFLRQVLTVENAVEIYKRKFGTNPSNIRVLHRAGLLHDAPADLNSGRLYLDSDGKVRSGASRLQVGFGQQR